jgi:type II secretory ATPase GspE/PulE/Tfp pilus assembly ATPase PilB-like protein
MPDALSGRFIINKPDERNARCWKEQVNTSRGIVGLTFQSVPSTTGSVTVVKIDSCSFHPRLDTLGMTTSQQLLVHKTIRNGSGIVVVAGTTGSGKSITANAIAHAAGLAGRKPLLVEEIRDESTLQSVHEYHRRTGGLIISTMLASSAISVFSRLRSMAPRLTEQLDLSVIPLVIYQTLRPRLCPACAINVEYTPHAVQAAVAQLADQYKIDTIGMRSIGTGCACCFDGTRGQTGIFEVIEPSYPMLEAISADNFSKAIGVWAQNADGRCDTDNMNGKFVMEHLLLLASQGIIDASAPVLRTVAM